MPALKHPELEEPVFVPKKMSLWEEWKYIRFHRNLQKVDERMLHEQIKIDNRAEGFEQGRTQGFEQGLFEGRTQGLAKGMVKNKLEVAKKALAKGLSVEIIHEITELDIETIKSL